MKWKSLFLPSDVPYQPTLHPLILEECNSINVTWSPPIPGALGDPVIGYLAQITRAGPIEDWINCTSYAIAKPNTCLFAQLETHTRYQVRVIAENRLGYSLPSDIVEIFTNRAGTIPSKAVNFIRHYCFFVFCFVFVFVLFCSFCYPLKARKDDSNPNLFSFAHRKVFQSRFDFRRDHSVYILSL